VEIGTTRVTILTGWQYHPVWRWLLVTLAVLVPIWWLRRSRRRSSRLLRNHQLARLFLRLLGFALFALLIYMGWRHFEGAEQLLPDIPGLSFIPHPAGVPELPARTLRA
jgi:hypothetical protein